MNAVGDGDRVRHCRECDLNVYNFSEMEPADAESLLRTHEGRLCAGFWQRTDGTILTRNCPVGLAALRAAMGKRLARMVALVGIGVSAVLFLTGRVLGSNRTELRSTQPFERVCEWLSPRRRWYGGVICPTPAPTPAPTPTPTPATAPNSAPAPG